jgi:ABC-type uncharacterized transport system auxiliary subunit
MTRAGRILALALLLPSGCVFRDAAEPRFFRPQSSMLDPGGAPPLRSDGAPVRLRPVTGTPFLRERIAWRASDVEYGLYEERRWSELPSNYVQRALETTLRRTPGVMLTNDLHAPVLRVEVVAFDEVVIPARAAAVSLRVSLRDPKRGPLLDRTFASELPAAEDTTAATAVAMGHALDTVAADVAEAVAAALRPAVVRRRG